MSSAIGLGFEALYGIPIHRLVESGELEEDAASAFVPFLEKIMNGVQHASNPVLFAHNKEKLEILYFDQQSKTFVSLICGWSPSYKYMSAAIIFENTGLARRSFDFCDNPVSFRAMMARIVA